MSIKNFTIDSPVKRFLLIGVSAAALVGSVIATKWGVGNTILSGAAEIEVAELAVTLAPDDPRTHFIGASLRERTFESDDILAAVAGYERSAALSPNNYLYWLPLARAREAAGDRDGAEAALRRARYLAPNYSRVRWALGNILLRQGKFDSGFEEMRAAAAVDDAYAAPLVTAASQYFEGDPVQIRSALGNLPSVLASYSQTLSLNKQFSEALDIWRQLTPEERQVNLETGGRVMTRMIESKEFASALRLANLLDDPPKYDVGRIFDGGFESGISMQNARAFEWRIADGTQPQIALTDGQRRSGAYSLLIIFRATTGNEFRSPMQTVVVEPGNSYAFEAFYRSDIKTLAKIRWQITAVDGRVLCSTNTVAPTAEWAALTCDFSVPADTEAIAIKLIRDECAGTACAVSGNLWLDDISVRSR